MWRHLILQTYLHIQPYQVHLRYVPLLLIASFRYCRYQQRPCNSDFLPTDRGGAFLFRKAGYITVALCGTDVARFAGQTKAPCTCQKRVHGPVVFTG